MQTLETFLNWLQDMDWGWWPFLHLRPKNTVRMTTLHVAKMSAHYGPIVALVIVLLGRRDLSLLGVVAVAVGSIAFFFVGYRLTFAVAWNRRAARLSGK